MLHFTMFFIMTIEDSLLKILEKCSVREYSRNEKYFIMNFPFDCFNIFVTLFFKV